MHPQGYKLYGEFSLCSAVLEHVLRFCKHDQTCPAMGNFVRDVVVIGYVIIVSGSRPRLFIGESHACYCSIHGCFNMLWLLCVIRVELPVLHLSTEYTGSFYCNMC